MNYVYFYNYFLYYRKLIHTCLGITHKHGLKDKYLRKGYHEWGMDTFED